MFWYQKIKNKIASKKQQQQIGDLQKSTMITSLKESSFDQMMWKQAILLELFNILGATFSFNCK